MRHWQKHLERLVEALNQNVRVTARLTIKFYQTYLSNYMGHNCRFYPSCSCYADEAFRTMSPMNATMMTVKRIVSCRPFGASGYDPLTESSQHE